MKLSKSGGVPKPRESEMAITRGRMRKWLSEKWDDWKPILSSKMRAAKCGLGLHEWWIARRTGLLSDIKVCIWCGRMKWKD